MIRSCTSEADFRELLTDSISRPVFLMKHSSRCSISAGAHERYMRFATEHGEVECWEVLVIEHRSVSTLIAQETGITHQSPQAILFRDGKAVWHTSHGSITIQGLITALEK